jgi:mannose PTS system EIIA component
MTTERPITGAVLVVHGDYGAPLLNAAERIVGSLSLTAVEVSPEEEIGGLRARISLAMREQDSGSGVLLLTDLCGSTPANLCLSLLDEHPGSEILTGVNLAMLVKLSTCDRFLPASALVEELKGTSQRSIQIGRDLLRKGGSCGD